MPGPDPLPAGLLAYGPVPGVELIPYFLALLAWVGLALGTLFLSPFTAAFRWLRRALWSPAAPVDGTNQPSPLPAPPAAAAAAPVQVAAVEGPRVEASAGEVLPASPLQEPPVEGPRDRG